MKRILGLVMICLGVALAIGVSSMVTAGAWDGMCGTDQKPVACDTTTGETTAPVPAPVPTTPEVTPTAPQTTPTVPTTTTPAPTTPVPTTPVVPASRVPAHVTCAWLRSVGAGRNWLFHYHCIKAPHIAPRRGPFNPAVTGEVR